MCRFGVVLGSVLAPFGPPNCLPFGTLLALKINQKIDPKSDCSKGRSKIAPRPPKTLPRRPPDPQDLPRCSPGPPRTPQDVPKRLFPAPGPAIFFGKIENSKSSKDVEKKSTMFIHGDHSTQSLAKIESRSQRSNPRGWRRWSREALFNNICCSLRVS